MITLQGEKFRELWKRHWPNQREFAEEAGVSPDTIVRAGRSESLRLDSITSLVNALSKKSGVSTDDLRRDLMTTTPRPFNFHDADPSRQNPADRLEGIPIISTTPASGFVDYSPDIHNDQFLPRALHDFPQHRPVAFKVEGDSMAPRIMPGDILVCATQMYDPHNDDILVVGLHQSRGHTVKRLRIVSDDEWELVPINQTYPTQRVRVEDIAWHALAVGVYSNLWQRRPR